ncbi:MAG: MATE family efflux transporter [Chitinophagaceae bacterium]|nr:MATE family efflux transporter [Chitinophagaceae bacterium]
MSKPTNSTNKVAQAFALLRQSLRGVEHDYTQGSIRQAIILLAIPMILELSLESVFAVVDMFFVGKLGKNAIQAVGLTESVVSLVYAAAIGLSTAATAMVARRIGEKDAAAASHAGAQALIVAFIVTVVISITGIIFAGDVLRLMGADEAVVREGTIFARITLGGSVVIILLFLINGIFRGAGNAAIAMKSLWLASLLNIILCPVLIDGLGPFPQMGLAGAAVATAFSRGMGVVYQCWHLTRGKSMIRMVPAHFKPNPAIIRSLFSIAWPATFQFLIASGSWIVLAWLVAHTGGTEASAGYQVAIRNVVFFILPAWGLSNAAATLVGQNLGAGQPERAEKSALLTARYNAFFMAGVTLLFLLLAEPIIRIFTQEEVVVAYGVKALMIIGSGYIFYGIGMVMVQALNGAGDTRTPTLINFFCFWIFQIPLAYLLATYWKLGPIGAFIGIPIAETLIAIIAFIYFKRGRWKLVKV